MDGRLRTIEVRARRPLEGAGGGTLVRTFDLPSMPVEEAEEPETTGNPSDGGPDRLEALVVGRPITTWAKDRFVALRGERLDLEVVEAPFAFDGGDLVTGPDRVVCDWNLIGRNPRGVQETGDLVELVGRVLRRPVLLLGDGPGSVPDHHLGMSVARTAAGIPVRRVPCLPVAGEPAFVSYTNVLCETRDGRKLVHLPVYGLESLDAGAIAAWEAEGYEVNPVRVADVWRHHGSLRCLVGVVERG